MVFAAAVLLGTDARPSVPTAVVLATFTVLSSWFPVRFNRRGGVQGFNLAEAALLAMLYVLPLAWVPAIFVVAKGLGFAVKVPSPRKLAFNIGQTGIWASAATFLFSWLAGPGADPSDLRGVLAGLAALATLNVLSLLAMSELFRRLDGRRYTDTWSEIAELQLLTLVGNASFGLVLATVVQVSLASVVPASLMMVGLFLGYRGYANALEERRRNGLLEGVAFTLADVNASEASVEEFLAGLARLFQARYVELALADADGFRFVQRDADQVTWDVEPGAAVAHVLGDGRADAFNWRKIGDAVIGQDGDSLAVPMIQQGRVLGVLAISDRSGFETSAESDATLLATLAKEAAVVLKNVELFAAVERERGRLAAESAKLGEVVNAASDGIAMIEADGQISVWNEAMERSTGIDADTAVGLPWDLAFRARDVEGRDIAADRDSVIHRILRGEAPATAVDVQVLRRDGAKRWLRCSVSPTARPGALDGAVIVARDVTHEREVAQLKGDFVATVSHELRTPLTPLRGFYETLSARRDELTPAQMDVILGSMGSQLDRLERTVGDLLFVADAHHGVLRFSPEPVALGAAVNAEITATLGLDERDRIESDDTPVVAMADRAAVARVARALVSNALKHTEGMVRITLLEDGDRAVLEVSDDGPGIAPWDQERIFERFTRLGDHLHRVQGSGLGLPIARSLARALDGDITVDSDLGAGATFRLSLPLAHGRREGDGDGSQPVAPPSWLPGRRASNE